MRLDRYVNENIYTYILCLNVFTLPFSLQLNSISIGLLVIVWLLEGKWDFKYEKIRQNSLPLLMIAFFCLHIIGLIYSIDIQAGLFDIEKKLTLLIFPLVLGSSYYTQKINANAITKFFIISCLVAALFCLAHAIYRYLNLIPVETSVYGGHIATQAFKSQHGSVSPIWDYITYSELTLPLKLHPTYFAMYLSFNSLYLAVLYLKSLNFKFANIKLIPIIFFTLFILLLSSRIIIIIHFLSMISLIIIIFHNKLFSIRNFAYLVLFILSISIIFLNIPLIKHRFTNDINLQNITLNTNTPGTGMSARLSYWFASSSTMMDNPLIGVGTGDVQEELDKHYIKNNTLSALGFNAHNQYLQSGAMLGIPALIILLSILILVFSSSIKQKKLYLSYFIMIVSITCLTESILQVNKGVVFFSLFASLFTLCSESTILHKKDKLNKVI